MRFSLRSRTSIVFGLVAVLTAVGGFFFTGGLQIGVAKAATHMSLKCDSKIAMCVDVADSYSAFDHYVGHDEPSTLFYSDKAGSGNRARYQLKLPKDPSAANPLTPGKSYNFQIHATFWFGMAMCATESYPEQVKTCTPDSDSNIVDASINPNHPGMAFMELQFYPPGFVSWPPGNSCDPTKWCAALNIDSLAEDPVNGTTLNTTCATQLGSIEYVNFAFVTKSGHAQAPANPVDSTAATFTPDPAKDLFMGSGDNLVVTMHDSANGLVTRIDDLTTGQTGSMTASAANGFGQVKYDPTGTSCTNIPYDFHPMYSTSSENTSVTWAIHTADMAFSDEIGHFDYCNGSNAVTFGGACPTGNTEGIGADTEPTDKDNTVCFPASASLLVQMNGCIGENDGFDGASYQNMWPDGNTKLHPTSVLFSSPLTGANYNVQYTRTAFESTLPANESLNGQCNTRNGFGCSLIPQTDDPTSTTPGQPAVFYPYYSVRNVNGGCFWQLGGRIPGSFNDFNANAQYGILQASTFTQFGGGGAPITRYESFRQVLPKNVCKA